MKIKNFNDTIVQVQEHLNEYLQEHGRDTSRLFRCINPEHPDKNPSCSTQGNDNRFFHCFSCAQGSGDIFKAAFFLEGKPLVGKEFITENLMYLASKFNIPIDATELTEEELYEIDTYRAYRHAAELVLSSTNDLNFEEAIFNRGWNKEICQEYGVGYIPSYKDFRDKLKELGFSSQFLDDIDLKRKDIFDEGKLIFIIKDEFGRPVGFASRNLLYTEDKQNGVKYVNQKTTGIKCNIYKKGSRLFGFDKLVKKHPKKSDTVYVFEGYADVITACQSGVTNCVAVGGAFFTEDQLQLLKDHGYYNICLTLDSDETGQTQTAKILDTTLSNNHGVNVSVVIIPDGMDPDDFIKTKGIEEFKKLNNRSAFEWRLLQFPDDIEAETICQTMIPLIVNETSHVSQEKMIKTLSGATGVSQKAIQAEVVRLLNTKEAEKSRERQNIIDKLTRFITRSPSEAEYYLSDAQNALQELNKRFNEDSLSEDTCLAFLDSQKQFQEQKSDKYMGFILGPDLKQFQDTFCGEWKQDVWITLGGKANCLSKKTTLLNPQTGLYENITTIKNVNSTDNLKNIHSDKVSNFYDSGSQEIFRVISDKGFFVDATKKHKFLTKEGWKQLKDINIKDYIASPAIQKYIPTCFEISEDKALFLGLMIGDGNYTQARPTFTNDDSEILNKIKSLAKENFKNIECPIYATKENNSTYEMIGLTQKDWKENRNEQGRCIENPIITWLKELKVYQNSAYFKHIPDTLLQHPLSIIKALLVGLFSTDGSIQILKEKRYTRFNIDYSSTSETLVRQIQSLLLRFGIVSSIRKKLNSCQTGVFESWYLTIRDNYSIKNFIERISFIGRKNILAHQVLEIINKKKNISNNRYENEIYWSKIKSIDSLGIQETCDIEVKNNHNFNLDGFVVHNSGKSAFLSKLAFEIANHQENNALVIYHSIDDSAEQLLPKFVCVADGSRLLTINQVQSPGFYAKGIYTNRIISRRDNGYNKIRSLIQNGNFLLKDSNDGTTIGFIDILIKYYKEKYPNKNIVYILDNFHKLQDFMGLDERVRFKALSTQIKGLATKHHICFISTIEYTKLPPGTKPSNNSVSETVQIEFDANAIIHLYNDLHEYGDKATHFHMAPTTDDETPIMMPRVEVIIGKNKISGFKGNFWLDFFPDCSDWAFVNPAGPQEDEKKAKSHLRDRFTSILENENA